MVSTLLIGSVLVVDGHCNFRENCAFRDELQQQQYWSFGEGEAAITNRQKEIAIATWILPLRGRLAITVPKGFEVDFYLISPYLWLTHA